MWSLKVTPVVGLPTYTDWSQAATFSSDSGKFVILLSVSGQSAAVVGQSVLNEIETNPPSDVQAVHRFLTDLTKQYPEQKFSVACLLFRAKKITLGAIKASILLHRDTSTGRVVAESNEVSLRSGKCKSDDVYVLLNKQAGQFSAAIKQHFSQGLVAEVVATTLIPIVQSNIDKSDAGAIALVELSSQDLPALQESDNKSDSPLVGKSGVLKPQKMVVATTELPKKHAFLSLIGRRALVRCKRIGIQVWLTLRSFNLHRNTIYVQSSLRNRWRKKILLVAGLFLIIGLAVVATWWWFHSQQASIHKELAPLEEKLAAAQIAVVEDPIAARQDAAQVVAELEALASTKGKRRFFGRQYTSALSQAQDTLTTLSGKTAVGSLPVFYDLRLAQSEIVTTNSHLIGNKGVFVDAEKKQAVVLDLSSKQVQVYSLSEIPRIQATTVGQDSLFLLGDGLWQLKLVDKAAVQQIKPVGDSNRSGSLLGSFGPYRYVLNPEKRNIFRYTQTTDAISDPIGWIVDPPPISYGEITSMTIDGDIWFASKTGQIFRYRSGRRQAFTISGLETKFSSSLLLDTSEKSVNLYVFEASKQRLVILSKEGVFLRQVRSPSLATVTSFFVDEANGFAYLTSGASVYQVEVAN